MEAVLRISFVASLILTLPMAGCIQDGPAARPESVVPVEASPGVVTADTGAVEGLVVDEEQVPVPGATVGIRFAKGDVKNQTISAETGSFSFSDLPPGDYELVAQAPFFESAVTRATVAAGEVTKVTIILKRLPAPKDVIVETSIKRGLITCSVGYFLVTGTYSMNPCQSLLGNNANFKVPLNPELAFREIVLELVWRPATGVSSSALRMILCSEKDSTTNFYGQCVTAVGSNPYYQAVSGASPLVLRRNNLPLKTVKAYEVAVGDAGFNTTSVRVPLTFQQSFDLYMSLCYNQNCTPAFQARPPA